MIDIPPIFILHVERENFYIKSVKMGKAIDIIFDSISLLY